MYTQEQIELLNRVNSLAEQAGSQNKACELLGISAAVMSSIRNEKYKGDVQGIFNKLAEYFGVKAAAEQTYLEITYAQTHISTQVYEIIRICQVKGGLAVACGDAGIGKTKAAKQYIKEHSNSILITINPCLTSIKSILKVIAEKVGATPEKSRDELWFSIANKLNDGMVLIFDEAQHLTLKTIEVLRSLSDYFADKGQTLGIAFIGNLETVNRMGSKKAEFSQISNRTKQKTIYSTKQIQRDDILKLFPILQQERKEQEIDFLWRVAQSPQALRGAINLFSNAYDNENYTYKGLVAMAKHMDILV